MYEELVKRLKHTASLYFALPTDGGDLSLTRMLSEAADVIEELSQEYESVAKSLTESVELVRKLQSPHVKIVRCKDCKHRRLNEHYEEKGYLRIKAICELDTGDPFELSRCAENDDWFCADGERKEGGQDDAG